MEYLFISIPRVGSQSLRSVVGSADNHISIKKYPNNNTFSFCFLREPLDRLYSWYSYHNYWMKDKYPIYNVSFEKWIENGLPHHWDNIKDSGVISPLNQSEFILDVNGNIAVDFVGIFDNFHKQATAVLNRIGINQGLPQIGKTERGKYDFKPSEVDFIKHKFQKDFELYECYVNFWKTNLVEDELKRIK